VGHSENKLVIVLDTVLVLLLYEAELTKLPVGDIVNVFDKLYSDV
jgi:hypothetical protein